MPRWRIFAVFSSSRVQHASDLHLKFALQRISHLHSKFALRPHHVWKYDIHPICDDWD